jgi:hypothetical protein
VTEVLTSNEKEDVFLKGYLTKTKVFEAIKPWLDSVVEMAKNW